jgi:outer membrane lipoprotein-sorting protein
MRRRYILIVVFLLPISLLFGQNFYRVCGDYSIKSKGKENAQLIIGRFYYDANQKQIIHSNTFPEFEKWVTSDTSLYKVVNNEVVERQTIPNLTQFSMYHLVLSNKLNDFGLGGSFYSIDNVKKENGLVISTWKPKSRLKKIYGRILISTKDNNLFGVVFYNSEDKIVKKQFFEEYQMYNGLSFPGRVVDITYTDEGELYQVTTYKNIQVNSTYEDSEYYFNPATN